MVGVRQSPRLPALVAHVFVQDVAAPALSNEDAHHLLRVLRLRDGERFTVGDGRGAWRECLIAEGSVRPDGDVQHVPEPSPRLTVGFALTKGDKPELTVQKLTELGIDRIVPIAAARSVVQWDASKSARNVERLRAVARAAAMQSRRPWLPEVSEVTTLAGVTSDGAALAHPDGDPLTLANPMVLIGPEGGWDEEELALVPSHVDLGTTTLRAETAALAAGVLLAALRDQRI